MQEDAAADYLKKYFRGENRERNKFAAALQVTDFLSRREAREFADGVKEFVPRFVVRENKNQGRTRKRYAIVRVIEKPSVVEKLVRMNILRVKRWRLLEKI